MGIQDPPGGVLPFLENNPVPKKNLREEAERFILENPRAYALFLKYAMEMLRVNRRFGIKLIAERVRWEVRKTWNEEDDRGFKLNNNHCPYIARQLIQDYPALEALIECRKTFW